MPLKVAQLQIASRISFDHQQTRKFTNTTPATVSTRTLCQCPEVQDCSTQRFLINHPTTFVKAQNLSVTQPNLASAHQRVRIVFLSTKALSGGWQKEAAIGARVTPEFVGRQLNLCSSFVVQLVLLGLFAVHVFFNGDGSWMPWCQDWKDAPLPLQFHRPIKLMEELYFSVLVIAFHLLGCVILILQIAYHSLERGDNNRRILIAPVQFPCLPFSRLRSQLFFYFAFASICNIYWPKETTRSLIYIVQCSYAPQSTNYYHGTSFFSACTKQ